MRCKFQLICLCLLTSFITACATPKEPKGYDVSKSEATLAEASYAVSQSVVDLAETAQAAHPLPSLASPPPAESYGMGGVSTIDWSGPVEPILKQIADTSGYQLRVLGTQPSIPVLITIYKKNAKLGDILRDVGYQCGRRATVVVYPGSRVVELRYAKN